MRWYDLRFVDSVSELEPAYRADMARTSLNQVRVALTLGFVLIAVFGVLDVVMVPDNVHQIWFIRYGILCPAVVLCFAYTFHRGFLNVMQPLLASFVVLAGSGISAMTVIADGPASFSYYAGNILVIIWGYTFVRMTFVWATFAGWMVVAGYQVAAIVVKDTPTAVLINNNFFFLSVNMIGMFAAYSIERFQRRDYLLSHQLAVKHAEVEQSRDLLEVRVEERTREAVAAAQAKSDFLANMSHEIRTPMNGVLGMLDLLRGESLSDEAQDYAQTAFRSAEGLLRILDDVLDLSKIDAGKLVIRKESAVPGVIIEDVCATLYPQVLNKPVELVPVLDASSYAPVLIDPMRLRQVLLNLLGNAIKFTASGHVTVRCQQAGEGQLRIEVCDTGVGITPTQQAAIFDPFVQADASTTRNFGGTGLGLAISARLMTLMDGAIELESTPGEGSTFTLRLTVAPAHPPDAEHCLSELGLPERAPCKVAVQVASKVLSQGLRQMLGALGCDLVPADTNAELTIADGAEGADLYVQSGSGERTALAQPLRLRPLARLLRDAQRGRQRQQGERAQCNVAKAAAQQAVYSALNILLVEDNPVNRRVAGAMFKRLQLNWQEAENGAEALRKLQEERFDLVFMDCQMPVLDGYAATTALREFESAQAQAPTPVIALTANAMQGDRDKCLAAGMTDYMSKPVKLDVLQSMLERWGTS